MMATARRLHEAGNPTAAEPLYRKVLEIEPGHVDARHLLGVVALQTGRAQEATELLERVAAADLQSVHVAAGTGA